MEGKVALITGAAGGIGAAVAGELCRRGVTVAAVDRDADRLSRTVEKLTADGLSAEAFSVDIASRTQVEAGVAAVEDRLGELDFLVNTAGVLRMGEVRDLTDQDWETTFAVNATGVFLMSRAVADRMVPRRRGSIVTVASNAASTARTRMAAYAASKAAATMFTKCLGLEVARYGIRCNLVAPGSTDTPMLLGMGTGGEAEKTSIIDGIPADYKVGIPLRKLARPSDVADAVVFLLSDRAGHITMQSLTVDGGATLGG
jgi:2,3-dihydro-2,3-dihydroxybenzoate dehydrogenase